KVKTLSGLLPICSSCKKIRDDNGYWNEVETYIHKYSEVEFSHGICPECMRKLYPEQYDRLVKQGKITDTSAKKK
ncbi:MAG: response regulator, partial [Candidatus Marinimicrobia bacterium]|nr:response regulator [Candidatus Neomarinimicrobiota bacterium]